MRVVIILIASSLSLFSSCYTRRPTQEQFYEDLNISQKNIILDTLFFDTGIMLFPEPKGNPFEEVIVKLVNDQKKMAVDKSIESFHVDFKVSFYNAKILAIEREIYCEAFSAASYTRTFENFLFWHNGDAFFKVNIDETSLFAKKLSADEQKKKKSLEVDCQNEEFFKRIISIDKNGFYVIYRSEATVCDFNIFYPLDKNYLNITTVKVDSIR